MEYASLCILDTKAYNIITYMGIFVTHTALQLQAQHAWGVFRILDKKEIKVHLFPIDLKIVIFVFYPFHANPSTNINMLPLTNSYKIQFHVISNTYYTFPKLPEQCNSLRSGIQKQLLHLLLLTMQKKYYHMSV